MLHHFRYVVRYVVPDRLLGSTLLRRDNVGDRGLARTCPATSAEKLSDPDRAAIRQAIAVALE
jgi:hypothetical protein